MVLLSHYPLLIT